MELFTISISTSTPSEMNMDTSSHTWSDLTGSGSAVGSGSLKVERAGSGPGMNSG